MIVLFLAICFVIFLLVLIMFFILKKTVHKVNELTKSYFIDKLQGYDELIDEKEKKLNELDSEIKNREKGIEDVLGDDIALNDLDLDVLKYLTSAGYLNENIFAINKEIDERFEINNEKLLKDFIKNIKKDNMGSFCRKIRKKFNGDVIYELKTNIDLDDAIKKILNDKEYKIYEMFKSVTVEDTIENFIDYLDRLVELNDSTITVMVGSKKENYNHLNKNIETVVDDKIYRGIKIVYKNKLYDFSLSERNI